MSHSAPAARHFGVPVLEDLPDPAGRKVLLRATLDLPLSSDPASSLSYVRAERLTASVRWLVDHRATVTVWGRPPDPEPAHPVGSSRHASRAVLEGFQELLAALDPTLAKSTEVLVEECVEDGREVARVVARHDLFVNDTLQDSRWPTPSMLAPPSRLPSAVGRSLEEDLASLEPFVTKPDRPFVAVLGGERTFERLLGLAGLVLRADAVLLGGALALPMLQALGRAPTDGKDDDFLWECRRVVGLAQRVRHRLVLPDDLSWAGPGSTCASPTRDPERDRVVDIGPAARLRFAEELAGAGSVFWAGSVGRVEEPAFRAGTRALAHALHPKDSRGSKDSNGPKGSRNKRVLLGGDALVDMLAREQLMPPSARVLTATDSAIELLKNGDLPAISAIRDGVLRRAEAPAPR